MWERGLTWGVAVSFGLCKDADAGVSAGPLFSATHPARQVLTCTPDTSSTTLRTAFDTRIEQRAFTVFGAVSLAPLRKLLGMTSADSNRQQAFGPP